MRWPRILSTVLLLAGGSLIAFPLVRIGFTALYVGPMQASALAAWEQQAPTASTKSSSGTTGVVRRPPSGLVLAIPRLGLKRYIPEGADLTQLRRFGVGRITWTALPDGAGIVGIAGHRTTYGAPFFRLNKLERGDFIHLDYAGKRFTYIVTERQILRPERSEVLQGSPGQRGVALVTCTPAYSAAYRLVILGTLQEVAHI